MQDVQLVTDLDVVDAIRKEMAAYFRDSEDYVRKHGGKSTVGFYRSEEGPKAIDE